MSAHRGITVKKENKEMGDDREECVSCGWETAYWWGDGLVPLCQICAAAITNHELRCLVTENGYPVPPRYPTNKKLRWIKPGKRTGNADSIRSTACGRYQLCSTARTDSGSPYWGARRTSDGYVLCERVSFPDAYLKCQEDAYLQEQP